MGGGGKFPYPKDVWTPYGGWWCHPRQWKRNTVLLSLFSISTMVPVFMYSARWERRYPPLRPIPSQKWCYYTEHDDPNYKQKLADYKAGKPTF